MLTKKDLELIDQNTRKTVTEIILETVPKIVHEIVSEELSEFAMMVQNGFREIMETKADKADIATKIDIERLENSMTRIENKFEGRIEKAEDNIRVIKTKLKIA